MNGKPRSKWEKKRDIKRQIKPTKKKKRVVPVLPKIFSFSLLWKRKKKIPRETMNTLLNVVIKTIRLIPVYIHTAKHLFNQKSIMQEINEARNKHNHLPTCLLPKKLIGTQPWVLGRTTHFSFATTRCHMRCRPCKINSTVCRLRQITEKNSFPSIKPDWPLRLTFPW